MKKIRTVFIGTAEFAVPILRKLAGLDYISLVATVTQPDRPVGRHQSKLQSSPVGELSASLGIRTYKPESLRKDADQILAVEKPDLIIVAAYGQMIPGSMLEYPKYRCLNIHGSLLPKLRGAVPVQMAILQGFEQTGVTIQVMEKRLDAGDIIAKSESRSTKSETGRGLMKKLAEDGAELLEEILPKWLAGEIQPEKQDETKATYCSKEDLSKKNAQILPGTSVNLAERMVRAFNPWPVAWGMINVKGEDKRIKIYKARISKVETRNMIPKTQDEIFQILNLTKQGQGLFLTLDNGMLELQEIQLEGKTKAPAEKYLYLAEWNFSKAK